MQCRILRNLNVMILLTLCLIAASVQWIDAAENQCQKCMGNGAYCMNGTHYYPCFAGTEPKKDKLYNCDSGFFCTNSSQVCVPESAISGSGGAIVLACPNGTGTSGSCKQCGSNKNIACITKTEYAMCIGGQVKEEMMQSCASDEICSMESLEEYGDPCIPQCAADFLKYEASCSNEVIITSTATPPVTEGITDHCDQACGRDDFCLTKNPNASDCKSYVYCEINEKGVWNFAFMNCPIGQKFDDIKKTCSTTATCN